MQLHASLSYLSSFYDTPISLLVEVVTIIFYKLKIIISLNGK